MLVRCSDDKPSDCKYCYFWMPGKKKCKFDECYYIVRKVKKKVFNHSVMVVLMVGLDRALAGVQD